MARKTAIWRPRDDSPTAEKRLFAEASLWAQLEHPNIPPLYSITRDSEGLRVATRWIDGRPWSEGLAQSGSADLVEQVEVLREVCRAVEHAHLRGVAHRDIKPSNVMLGAEEEVFLVGWSAARDLNDTTSTPAGTPAYVAPEVARGDAGDASSDIYLLGGVLYRLLTGAPPHGDTHGDKAMAHARSRALPRFADDLPAPLADCARRALDPLPSRRHPSAAAFRAELEAWLAARPLEALLSGIGDQIAELKASLRDAEANDAKPREVFYATRTMCLQAATLDGDPEPALAMLHNACALYFEHALANGRASDAQTALEAIPPR
ncbi:MAG: serine/threonine protein kinase [Proteobacteria bacterium]|nr:serine/threonine protein kinase [Pseudomonadota bacterium]